MRGGIQKKGNRYYAVVYDGVDPGTGRRELGSNRPNLERRRGHSQSERPKVDSTPVAGGDRVAVHWPDGWR